MGTDYIDLGRVAGDTGTSMRYRNSWANGIEYVHNDQYIDMVTHAGSLWVCNTTNTSQEPTEESETWHLAARGIDDGASISDAISAIEVPENYVEPESGGTVKDIFGKLTKGVRELFARFNGLGDAAHYNVSDILTAGYDDTGKVPSLALARDLAEQIATLNNNLAKPVHDNLWSGTAGAGQTITLSKSIYDYSMIYFSNDTDGIRAMFPVANGVSAIRAGGSTVTIANNIGTFGVAGEVSNGGKTIKLTNVGYITQVPGSNNSALAVRKVTRVFGIR